MGVAVSCMVKRRKAGEYIEYRLQLSQNTTPMTQPRGRACVTRHDSHRSSNVCPVAWRLASLSSGTISRRVVRAQTDSASRAPAGAPTPTPACPDRPRECRLCFLCRFPRGGGWAESAAGGGGASSRPVARRSCGTPFGTSPKASADGLSDPRPPASSEASEASEVSCVAERRALAVTWRGSRRSHGAPHGGTASHVRQVEPEGSKVAG